MRPPPDSGKNPDGRREAFTGEYGKSAYGRLGAKDLSAMQKLALWLPDAPQGLVDFSAGWGDSVSFGLTGKVRDWIGVSGEVDPKSGAYLGGTLTGTVNLSATGGAAVAGALRAGRAGKTLPGSRKLVSLDLRLGHGQVAALSLVKHTKALGPSGRLIGHAEGRVTVQANGRANGPSRADFASDRRP